MDILDIISQPTPPRREVSPATEHSIPEDQDSDQEDELPTCIPTESRKRRAEDNNGFALTASRNVRLKKGDENSVLRFAQLSSPQQRITVYAELRSLSELVARIKPGQAVFTVPDSLVRRIERYSFTVLVSPTCQLYIKDDSPFKLILSHLESNPQWGLTEDIRNTTAQYAAVKSRLRKALTNRRNVLKTLMKTSLGHDKEAAASKEPGTQDILQLCEAIIASGASTVPTVPKVSLQMLARFALLRKILEKCLTNPAMKNSEDYWNLVDKNLKAMRERKDTPKRISEFFAHVLEEDYDLYGDKPRAEVSNDVPPLEAFEENDSDI
ncbi:hypothetical protein EST38_g7928 [Candolleomyces aberdarensis]|uniref:Uncharacterized protein n=1 Tax=Candolleomyces aberdarensis TaxID=2316362 RepID=A0A4Q2DHB0_9AGAR|nr:hypothetical protein EST38_g7928 [Candolleomyces aberdarensis]